MPRIIRKYVPLIACSPTHPGRNLGIRHGFYDIAQTIAKWFKIPPIVLPIK
jgi:phosphopentomutase